MSGTMTERQSDSGDEPARLDVSALVFWLVIMFGAVYDLARGRERPVWLGVAALAGFGVLYVATVRTAVRADAPRVRRYGLLAALAAYTVPYVLWFGHLTVNALILVSMAAGAALPLVWWAAGGVIACTALTALVSLAIDPSGVFDAAFGAATAGTVIVILRRLFVTIGELRATREELAHAAVSRERLRFARDLHDLLGHTLSLIVVKGEIVQRLATRDPEAAAAQAGDIITIGRDALGEVRQAVSGYRARGVSAELDDARMALDDAGVAAVVTRSGPPPPAEADLLLGWVVREAVTNVIRHAGARQCRIDVTGNDAGVSVTVADDGRGATTLTPGNGLTGLTERLTAAGGDLRAEPGRRGGFTVTARVPVDAGGTETEDVPAAGDARDAGGATAAGPEGGAGKCAGGATAAGPEGGAGKGAGGATAAGPEDGAGKGAGG